MDQGQLQEIDQTVKGWLRDSRKFVLTKMAEKLNVAEKSSRKDLVTNVDKANEQFLIERIRQFSPNSQILGEEGFGDKITETSGWVWVVDPIDGTMNFVKQQDHFATMIALYIDGQGVLGYINDIMNDDLYSGGPQLGVFKNEQRLPAPANLGLADGLIGISGPLILRNQFNMQIVAEKSAGVRAYGSAGIEISHILSGKLNGYISYLKPWDFGAGKILAETLGLSVTTVDGKPLGMLSSDFVMVATEKAQRDILPIVG